MNNANQDWMLAKAEQLLADRVKEINRTKFPEPVFAQGMIEALYAVGLFNDVQKGYWEQTIDLAVHARRIELRAAKNAQFFTDQTNS